MGLFDKILRNMPGSPKSIAKLQYNIYKRYKSKYPEWPQNKIFRNMLIDRYSIMKTVKEDEFENIISNCDNLIEFVLSIVVRENPPAMMPSYQEETIGDILKWFIKTAPEEYEKFTARCPDTDKREKEDYQLLYNLESKIASLIDNCRLEMIVDPDSCIIMYRDNSFAWGAVSPKARSQSENITAIISMKDVEPEYTRLVNIRRMSTSSPDLGLHMATDMYARHALSMLMKVSSARKN